MTTSNEPSTALVPWQAGRELAHDLDLADRLAAAHLLPAALRQRPADLLLIMLHGRDLGLSVSQALRGLHVVEGKVVLSADLMLAMCLQRPQICEAFRLVTSTDQVATYEAKRRGQEAVRLSWTIKQAQDAGLAGRGNWKGYPAAMLRARCIAALARATFPDLLFGVYDTDELASGGAVPAPIVATPVPADDSPRYAITPAGEAALEASQAAGAAPPITEASAVAPVAPERPAGEDVGQLTREILAAKDDDMPAIRARCEKVPEGPAKNDLRRLFSGRREWLAKEAQAAAAAPAEVAGEVVGQ